MTPTKSHVVAHLFELFDWAKDVVPDARFEVRCLDPDATRKPDHRQFTVCQIENAADWAVSRNLDGFNCYTTANLIRPHALPYRFCDDADIFASIHQFIDCDGTDNLDALHHETFRYSMIVITGTSPMVRMHGYFRLTEPVVDMARWSETQKSLAAHFGTDSVFNPSRIVRLAGTINYPSARKRGRGYVTEMTEIMLNRQEADNEAFYAAFPPLRAVVEPVEVHPPSDDAERGNVPLPVVAAALDAIPPITHGHRNHWIALCHAVIDANPAAQHEWDVYQARGVPHEGQSKIWSQLKRKGQKAGSYELLFKLACVNQPDWWRQEGCKEWWQSRAETYHAANEKEGTTQSPLETKQMGIVVNLDAHRPTATLRFTPAEKKPQTDAEIKAARRAATAYLRDKMRRELENVPRQD